MSMFDVLNFLNNDAWQDKGDTLVSYILVPGIAQDQITVEIEGNHILIRGENRALELKINKTLSNPTGNTNPRFRYENGLLIFTVDKIIAPRRRLIAEPANIAVNNNPCMRQ